MRETGTRERDPLREEDTLKGSPVAEFKLEVAVPLAWGVCRAQTKNLAAPAFPSVLSGDWGWSLPTLGMVFPFLLWLVCSWAEHHSVWIEPGLKFWHPWAATKQQPPKCHTVYGKKWAVSACFFPLCGYKRRSTSASQRYGTDFRTNSGLERWAGYQMVSPFLCILRF